MLARLKSHTISHSQIIKRLSSPSIKKHTHLSHHPHPKQLTNPNFSQKMQTTTANAISKLLPGGFCWQAAAELSETFNNTPGKASFAAGVGIADAVGVGLGHFGYKITKHYVARLANHNFNTNWDVPDIKKESQTSLMLATASFFSGSAWQPTVDLLKEADLSFMPTSVITGLVCGACFFGGLRISRMVYPKLFGMTSIKANAENRQLDATLSMIGIAGATGLFVATDVDFSDNPLKETLGANQAPLTNMTRAGTSTLFGFFVAQTTQNILASARDKLKKPTEPKKNNTDISRLGFRDE